MSREAEGGKTSNWIGFFSVVTDTQQIKELDKWIRQRVSQHFYQTYKLRVKRTDFRRAGLGSLIREYYKHKTPRKPCSCQSLDLKLILFISLLTKEFNWFKKALVIHLILPTLRN